MNEERPHHPYSPSSLQSLEACSCFKSRPSDHIRTIMGAIAHKSTETKQDDSRLSDDDAAAVAECMDFYERRKYLMEEERRVYLAQFKTPPGPTIELTEAYLPIDDCHFDDCEATTAGYIDRVIISWNRYYAELFDWKFGRWPIEKAENNLQGIAYALGLFRKYPELYQVKFWFKQPAIQSLQEAVFTRPQIPELYLRVQTVVARAREARQRIKQDDWSMANPMVPACNFCANLGLCPKVAEFACRVGSKFFPLQIPENITPTMVQSPEQTTLALRLSQVMSVWAKSFRSVVTDRVIRRAAVVPDGYELTSRAEREICDKAKYKSVALQYLTEDEYNSALDVSFGAIEDKISEKAARGQKAATVESFKQKLLDSGAVKPGQPYTFLRATPTKTNTEKIK